MCWLVFFDSRRQTDSDGPQPVSKAEQETTRDSIEDAKSDGAGPAPGFHHAEWKCSPCDADVGEQVSILENGFFFRGTLTERDGWPLCTDFFGPAHFYIENIFYLLLKTSLP